MPNHRPHHPPSRGRYFMQRGWQEHPVFPVEPFTAREAWEWLISEAFWKDGRARAGKFVVSLQRGQLCASVRHLARCWQWKNAKVERFLKRLKTETMIETRSETGISIITICNYDRFQTFAGDGETPGDTRGETVPRRQRDKKENNQDNYTIKDSEESFSLFPAQAAPPAPRKKSTSPPYSEEFEVFWRTYPRNNGSKKEAFNAYQQKIKIGVPHGAIYSGAEKYRAAHEAKGGGTAYVKHAHRWLNHDCWTNDYAIDAGARGNAVSIHGKGATGYFNATRQIIEERNARATALEQTPHT